MKTREAIILAGGMGTRLKGVIDNIPKPMAPVCDKPFLEYIFRYLKQQGLSRVILSVGYRHEVIQDYFGLKWEGMEIDYAIEDKPLGTGGAIRWAMENLQGEKTFVINGDTFFDIALQEMEQKSNTVLALKPMSNFNRYGTVRVGNNKIVAFDEKKQMKEGLINGGVYFLSKSDLTQFSAGQAFSFEKDFLEKAVKQEQLSYLISDNYFIDIGIPEDYKKVQVDFCKK